MIRLFDLRNKEEQRKLNGFLDSINKTPFPEEEKFLRRVEVILQDVRKRGVKALLDYTEKFDRVRLKPEEIEVSLQEIEEAREVMPQEFLIALRQAQRNITCFHLRQLRGHQGWQEGAQGVVKGERCIPLSRIGIYVPGGKASLASTVLMSAIPAQIAGVSELVMVTPPGVNKKVSPYVLTVASMLGINEVYRIGGIQAIAAMAFGIGMKAVDKIVGPGNVYVSAAKWLVSRYVGIDMIAGPSEVMIIADADNSPAVIAADLISQAEHDGDASVIFITTSQKLLDAVKKELGKQLKNLPQAKTARIALANKYSFFCLIRKISDAIELANRICPEHLQLMVNKPRRFLDQIRNAGTVLLGKNSPTAVSDYIAGSNHILPTGGAARYRSPLGIEDFIRRSNVVQYGKVGLQMVGQEVMTLARAEGLEGHARAVQVRLGKKRGKNS